jgi:hypothetical protein
MVAPENDYHARGIIAVVLCDDPWFHVTREAVQEAFGRWLGVPNHDVAVDFYPDKGFLVLLPTSGIRDRALSSNAGLGVGQAKLHLRPWTRLAGAESSTLPFRVRLCIEGIPQHAR